MKASRKKKTIFIIVATFSILFLLEGSMRLLRQAKPHWFEINRNTEEGYALVPNPRLLFGPGTFNIPYRTNSFGWRGPELSSPKIPGSFRIMFLGDSSVWGWDVAEEAAFPYLTGALLEQNRGEKVEVANAGSPGYSSTQCRIVFEDSVDKIDPDALVIATLWSDIQVRPWTDAQLFRKFSTEGYRFESKVRLFLRKSALFSRMEVQIESLKGIPNERFVALGQARGAAVNPSSTDTPRVSVLQHEKNLRAMASRIKAGGKLVCLLILPCDFAKFPWPEDRLESYKNNFREVAREFDGVLLDMTDVFPSDPAALSGLFLSDGIHPNVKGHKIIAKALATAINNKLKYKGN